MGLLSAIGGAVSGGFSDIVGDFFNSAASSFGINLGGFVTDILGGAVTNAAVAGLAGGDIGKAALYGAVGGGLSGAGLGTMGTSLGGAVRGYGLAESVDGNGLVGALTGAGGAFLANRSGSSGSSSSSTAGAAANANKNVAQNGSITPPASGLNNAAPATPATSGTASGPIMSKLQSLGLVDANGEGTLLGKALVTGVGSVAQMKSTEALMEKQTEEAQKVDENKAKVDHEAEQKRIAAFTGKQPSFRINRNG